MCYLKLISGFLDIYCILGVDHTLFIRRDYNTPESKKGILYSYIVYIYSFPYYYMPMARDADLKYRCEHQMACKSGLVLMGTLHSDQPVAYCQESCSDRVVSCFVLYTRGSKDALARSTVLRSKWINIY